MSGKIQGAFYYLSCEDGQFKKSGDLNAEEWRKELLDMRSAGIEDMILHNTMAGGRTHFLSQRVFESWTEREPIDKLAMIMQAAEAAGVGVYLGLYHGPFLGHTDTDFDRLMKRTLNVNQLLLEELLDLYGNHPCLRGFYVPNELEEINISWTSSRTDVLRKFFGDLYETVKKSCRLPVLISPFFQKKTPAEEIMHCWDNFLDRSMFDIVAMQDGAGCARGVMIEEVSDRFLLFVELFRKHKITLWANIESFSMSAPEGRSKLVPAPIERRECQWQAVRPSVERIITWEYASCISRILVGEDWYEAFKQWNLGCKT